MSNLVQLDFLTMIHLPPVWTAPIPSGYGHWCCPHCHDAARGFEAPLSFPATNNRQIGQCRTCNYEHHFSLLYGQTPNGYPETRMDLEQAHIAAHIRTGFPKICPAGHANPVCMANCESCPHHQADARLHWRCNHPAYQKAIGVHWCLGCGMELGPWAEAHNWHYCGGPTNQCMRDWEITNG